LRSTRKRSSPTFSLIPGANSGASVSISNDTAVVGAPQENGGAGAAYVFVRTPPSTWTLQQKLSASDAAANALFGTSVSISGDRIAIGAPGRSSNRGGRLHLLACRGRVDAGHTAAVLRRRGGRQVRHVGEHRGHDARGGRAVPRVRQQDRAGQGTSSLHTTTSALDAVLDPAELQRPGEANDHLGSAVSLSGNTALVGFRSRRRLQQPRRQRQRDGLRREQTRSGRARRRSIRATAAGDRFGAAVSLFVNTAIIGAPLSNSGRGPAFRVHAHRHDVTQFPNTGAAGAIVATDGVAGDNFGASVAVSGQLAAIGAPLATSAAGAGGAKAYIFGNTGAAFTSIDASHGDHQRLG
jgi:hypothetical protein